MHEILKPKIATDDDIEAVAEAIELVVINSSEEYAKAAITALIERGWLPRS